MTTAERKRGIGAIFDKQIDTGSTHKAASLAMAARTVRQNASRPETLNPMQQSTNHNLPPAIRDAIDTRHRP